MRHQPSEEEGRASLLDHATAKAWEARQAHGGLLAGLSMDALRAILADRRFIRHPVELRFGGDGLLDGELAHVAQVDPDDPARGFVLSIHPAFEQDEDIVPLLAAYQLVRVNYGDIAGPEAAEAFGATLCGMPIEDYYETLCQIADALE